MNMGIAKCCVDGALTSDLKILAKFLRSVGDENRLRILCYLNDGEKCVCDIWEKLGMKQNLVSSHLGVLRDSGLIVGRREGKKVFYSIDRKKFKESCSMASFHFIKYG